MSRGVRKVRTVPPSLALPVTNNNLLVIWCSEFAEKMSQQPYLDPTARNKRKNKLKVKVKFGVCRDSFNEGLGG